MQTTIFKENAKQVLEFISPSFGEKKADEINDINIHTFFEKKALDENTILRMMKETMRIEEKRARKLNLKHECLLVT